MGVLLMLMTIAGVVAAAVLLTIAYLNESLWLRKFVLGASAIWSAFYFALLILTSLLSAEKTLPMGEAKEFCGFYLDCHMHTAVTAVTRTKNLGNKTAVGEFYIVTVKVFSNAKRATLGLSGVDAHVVDSGGRTYARDIDAESQLLLQPEFDDRIAPDESFEKKIVFDLTSDIKDARLDISTGSSFERIVETLLIGDEDSLLHNRIYFALAQTSEFG